MDKSSTLRSILGEFVEHTPTINRIETVDQALDQAFAAAVDSVALWLPPDVYQEYDPEYLDIVVLDAAEYFMLAEEHEILKDGWIPPSLVPIFDKKQVKLVYTQREKALTAQKNKIWNVAVELYRQDRPNNYKKYIGAMKRVGIFRAEIRTLLPRARGIYFARNTSSLSSDKRSVVKTAIRSKTTAPKPATVSGARPAIA